MFIPMTVVLPPDDLVPFNEVIFHLHLQEYKWPDPALENGLKDFELDNADQDPRGAGVGDCMGPLAF